MSNAGPEEDLSNWPEDRFESHWTGPHDHHAMAYAAEKGISYYTGGGTVIEIGSATGLFETAFLETPVGQYSEALLRAANKASDAETRARHAADYERDTGTCDFKPSWRDATRGAKLRSIDNIRTACQENVTALKKKLLKVKKAAKEQHLNMTPFFSDVKSTARIRLQKKQLELCDHMEQLILAEINEGWDWRTGIKEQMAIRKQQDRIVELLNIFVFLMDGI